MFAIRARRLTRAALLGLLLLATSSLQAADVVEGKVVKIADGDTFTLLTPAKKQIRVRLAEIDTPERGQPWGNRSRQALAELVFNNEVRVVRVDIDRYGRLVGRVYVDNVDVNAELVRNGHAWVYRKYVTDDSLYDLEAEARDARRGLWVLPEAQRFSPWDWRSGTRSATAPNTEPIAFECGTKQYCREMTSCEEARFYLTECGLTSIDGDGDDIPCERLCADR